MSDDSEQTDLPDDPAVLKELAEALAMEANARAAEARAHAARAKILGKLAGAKAAEQRPLDQSPPERSASNSQVNADSNPLKTMPLPDAIHEHLKGCGEKAQSAPEIVRALKKAGREFETDHPVRSVRNGLKYLALKNSDLLHVRYGRWNLRSNYSVRKLNRLLKKQSGTGGFSREDHVEKTKAGLSRLRDSGARLGQPPKMTAEKYTQFLALMHDGWTQARAAVEIGVSASTLYVFRKQHDLESWRPSDPWPPPLKASEASSPTQGEVNVLPFAKGA